MAKNIASYIANLGKSVTYSAVDRVKEMTPTASSFVENNSDLFKDVYQSVRDYKVTYKRGLDVFKKSKIYEAGDLMQKSIISDIKTGKFYNKDRERDIEDKISSDFMNDGDSMDGFDLDSFDMDLDSENSSSKSKDNIAVRALKESSRQDTDALSMAMVKTGEYVVENQRINNNILYTQNMQAYGLFNKNLNAINDNVSNLLQFSTSVIQTTAENSKKYYEESTKILREQTKLLQVISDNVVIKNDPKKKKEKRTFSNDLMGSNDELLVSNYIKNVKSNLSEMTSSFGMMQDMFGENSNPLLAFASSPLKFIPNMIAKKIIPSSINNSMKLFDKSLSGFFGSLIGKFNTMGQSDNIISSIIGKVLGIKNKAKSSLNTAEYNKGKAVFDGKFYKSVTEVIPAYFSKIISILTGGKHEKVYDYDKGKFTDTSEIKESFNRDINRYQKNATFDMREEFDKYMKLLTFNSLKEKESLHEDIDKFFKNLYKSGKVFDVNNMDDNASAYMDYGVDEKNFKIIRQMFKNAPKHKQFQINTEIMKQRDAQTKYMENLEKEGNSMYNLLFNGYNIGEYGKNKKGKYSKDMQDSPLFKNNIKNVLDNKGHNMFYYLQNMYRELQFLRKTRNVNPTGLNRAVRVVDSNGNSYREKELNINDDTDVPLKDNKYNNTRRRIETENRNNERYLNKEKERLKKSSGVGIVNVSDIDDEKKLYSKIQNAYAFDETRNKVKKERQKEPTLIDKLLQSESISAKSKIVMETLDEMSKKPIKFFTDVLDKVDQRMYDIIYGNPDEQDQERGFMDVMIEKTKDTFNKLNTWLDDTILTPLKEKLQIEKFSDLGDKFLGMFGTSSKELKESIHNLLFDKDTGILTTTKEATKRIFKGAFDTVKDSVKSVYTPISDKVKSLEIFNRPKKIKMNAEDEAAFDELDKPKQNIVNKVIKKQKRKPINKKSQKYYSQIFGNNDYQSALENMSEDEQLQFLESNINDFDAYTKYNISDYTDKLANSKKNIKKGSKNSRALRKELYNASKKKDEYYDQSKLYLTLGLSKLLGTDNDQNDLLKNAIDMSITRDILKNDKNKRKTMDTLNMDSLLHSLSLQRGDASKDLMKRLSSYNDEIYDGSNLSLRTIVENQRKNPVNKKKSVEEFIEEHPNFVGVSNGVSSSPLLDIISNIKEDISGIFNILKDASKFKPKHKSIQEQILDPNLNTGEGQAVLRMSKKLSNIIANWLYGNMPHYDKGSGVISEPHMATVGEGETVLNKETTQKLTDVLLQLLKSSGDENTKNSDIAKSSFKNLKKLNISKSGKIINLFNDSEKDSKMQELLDRATPDQLKRYNNIKDTLSSRYDIFKEKANDVKEDAKEVLDKKINPFVQDVGNELKSGAKASIDSLFGRDPNEEHKEFNNVVSDITGNMTKYAPEAVGSALLGGGVSLLTGAIGGPLLGASVGAGMSLIKNSEKAQEWLFGQTIDGERQGGLVSKNTIKSFKKYFPDLKDYGITGGVAGLLPFVPFGPVGGLIIGSAFGFAKNNEEIKKSLFGDSGLISTESKDKIKKMLPKAAAGALVGSFVGPFGLLGNTLIGSSVGLATGTDKFKEILIGKYDPNTKRYENGILSEFRDSLIIPLKKGMKSFKDQIGDFLKNEIFTPFKKFLDPIKQQTKVLAKGALKGLGKIGDKIFEGAFGVPFHKFIQDKFVNPISNSILRKLNWVTKLGKNIISAPFKGLGAIGTKLRKHQIKKGTAYDMSAEDRLKFRKNNKMGNKDKFRSLDLLIKNLSQEGLDDLGREGEYITGSSKDLYKRRKNIAKDMSFEVSKHFGYDKSVDIMNSIKNHGISSALDDMGMGIGNIENAPDVIKYMYEAKHNMQNMNAVKKENKNKAFDLIKDQFGNDEETKVKLNNLLNSNNKDELFKVLSSKLSKKDANKLMSKLNDNYFDVADAHKNEHNKIYENIQEQLGSYVGDEDKEKILSRIKSGDIDTAARMLSVKLRGDYTGEFQNKVSEYYKSYQDLNEKQNKSHSAIEDILNKSFDKEQKDILFKYLNKGDMDSVDGFIKNIPKDKAEKLTDELNPLLPEYISIMQGKKSTYKDLKKYLKQNGMGMKDTHNALKSVKAGKEDDLNSIISPNMTTSQRMQLLEFISDKYKDFEKLEDTTHNKNKIKEDLYSKIRNVTGVDMDDKQFDYFMSNIKGEMKYKDKHYKGSSAEENDKKVKEDAMDKEETYHHTVLDLFEEAVGLLKKVADPTNPKIRTSEEVIKDRKNSKDKDKKIKDEKKSTNNIAEKIADTINDNVDHFASGGYINKPQLATVGKGEAIFSEENTSKLLDVMKTNAKIYKNKSHSEEKRSVVKDAKGNVVEYKKDNKGEWVPDLGDTSTRKAIDSNKKEQEQNTTLLSRLGKILGKNKDDEDKKKKKKKGFLGKILGLLGLGKGLLGKLFGGGLGGGLLSGLGGLFGKGLFGRTLGMGATILALPQIIKFSKDFAIPVMSQVYQNSFKPWLKNDAVPWLKEKGVPYFMDGLKYAAKELPSLIGQAFKFALTDLIPTLAQSIGDVIGLSGRDGEESVKGRVGKVVGRHILTGGATSTAGIKNIGKKTTEKFTEKGLFGKIGYGIAHPIKSTVAAGSKVVGKTVNKATDKVNSLYSKVDNFVKEKAPIDSIKEKGNKAFDYLKTKISSSKIGKAGEAITEKGNVLLDSFIKNIKEFLTKLFTHPKVSKLAGSEAVQKIIKDVIPKIVKTISERALKVGAEVTGKLLAATSTGGVLNLVWAVADFISGFRDAKNILSITEEPSIGMRFCSGTIKALNGLFIVTSFIPEKLWVDLIANSILPIFGKQDGEFNKLREKAQKEVDKYNKENGTNYSVEQYNKNVKKNKQPGFIKSITNSKFVKAFAGIGKKIGKAFSNMNGWLGKKVQSVKDFGSNMMDNLRSTDIWKTGSNIANKISNGAKNAKNKAGEFFNNAKNSIGSFLGLGGFGEGNERPKHNKQKPIFEGGFGLSSETPRRKRKEDFGIGGPRYDYPITDKPMKEGYGDGEGASSAGQTVKNGMVYYSQGDPKWKDKQYGSNSIGKSACGPTSAAMVISSLTGKPITPVETAAYSVSHGFREPGIGTKWGFYNSIGKEYGINFSQTNDRGAVVNALKNKQPVIFSGQGPVPFTRGGHFVVGAGMNGDNIKINDPVSLERSKDYSQSTIFDHMAAAWISDKALDGKLVDSSGNSQSSGDQQPQEQEKPSIMSMFSDFGKTFANGINRFYGFDAISPMSNGSSGSSGAPSNGLASSKIVNYIKSKEGFYPTLYSDSGGTPTIGYGSTHGWIMKKGRVTKEEATKALNEELQKVASDVKANLDKKGVKLNQNEFDAVCSFAYNLGTGGLFNSTLYKKICAGERGDAVTNEFMKFVHCGSQTLPGLVTRRREEAAIFSSGNAPSYSEGGGFGDVIEKIKNTGISIKNKLFGMGAGTGTTVTTEDLKKFFKSGKLYDNADKIIEASNKYKVDPALSAAIMMMETGGSSYALNKQNNPAGISGNGGPKSFSSLQEGIDYSVKNLKTTYFDKGLNTIQKIGNVYCPVGAANDPNGTNAQWVPGVKKFYKQITGKDDIDGTVTGSASSSNNSNEQQQEEKPGVVQLFMDAAKSVSNAANRFYGFEDIQPVSSGDANNTNGGGGATPSGLNKDSANVADDWFKSTLNAIKTSDINPSRYINGRRAPHYGIDYGAKSGTPIKSPISGTVYANKNEPGGFGNYLVIKDDKGFYHYFGHMQKLSSLKVGAKVNAGQSVGPVGSTGFSTGSHLHYEVRTTDGHSKVNPNEYLKSYYNKSQPPKPVGGEKFKMKKVSSQDYVAYPAGGGNGSLDKDLILSIINILTKICENTSTLSDIVKILGSVFKSDDKVKQKIDKINTNNQNSRNQIINIVKDKIKNSNDEGNEYLLNTLEALALQ